MNKQSDQRHVDYFAIDVPEDKDPSEYTYAERRAELLQRTEDLGDPKLVSRTKAAERYGVNKSQITHDMHRIADYLADNIDKDRYTFRLQTAFNKIYERFMEEGKYMKAWKLIRDWGDFLFDIGKIEREPDKLDLTGGFEVNIERFEDDEGEDEDGDSRIEGK